MKKVSVIVPTYNSDLFIRDCLESILSQDYPNIQIVVSDDASSDQTVEIVREFCALYPGKIDLNINSVNLGVTNNCNIALKKCDGEYLCPFAGDDVMLPGKISEQVSLLEANENASLCYHRVEVFNHDDGKIIDVTEANRTIFSFFDILEKGGLPGANSVMARMGCIPFEYNRSIPYVSDWLFFLEIALRGEIVFSSNVLSRYRKHGSGCSSKADLLMGETLETVDLIFRRFGGSARVSPSCRKAKLRYLLGSVARLVATKNQDLLMSINEQHIRSVSLALYTVVWVYCRVGLINTPCGKLIFRLGRFFKNWRDR